MRSITVADYLWKRLKEAGVESVQGFSGDYNLLLVDSVQPLDLDWVGNCNELNGGYATDGYARIKGIGTIVTTFRVEELSAINAVAGSYAERVPIFQIVGTPNRQIQSQGLHIHHSLCNSRPEDFDAFATTFSPISVARENLLDPELAPQQIDRLT